MDRLVIYKEAVTASNSFLNLIWGMTFALDYIKPYLVTSSRTWN
jgi:hypothetical protein